MNGPVYIGIDAGGTRLRLAAEATSGKQTTFETAGVNLWRDGIEIAARRVNQAVVRAASELGEARRAVVLAGIAGAMNESLAEELGKRLVKLEGPALNPVRILSDVQLAHYAAHGPSPGMTVVVGTGSVVFVRSPSGQERVVGGWGYRLGDEGSGYAIARAALRSLADAVDRSRPSPFEHLVTRNPDEPLRSALLRFMYGDDSRIQNLTPAVIVMARKGVTEAVSVVDEQIRLLADQIVEARTESIGLPHRITLTGGLSSNPWYVERLVSRLRTLDPGLDVAAQDIDAANAALGMAKALVNCA